MKKIDYKTAESWWGKFGIALVILLWFALLGPIGVLLMAGFVAFIVGVFYVIFKAPTWIQKAWNYFATEE